jgi:phosphatidylserine decarboxylase
LTLVAKLIPQTFNSFFSRRLKPTARPITSPADLTVVTSPADCRLTAFQTVDQAKTFWQVHHLPRDAVILHPSLMLFRIKGQQFNIPTLLVGSDAADTRFKAVQDDPQCSILISRLAPQDYHRFHAPFDGVVVDVKDIKGASTNLCLTC